jgi:predicted secreted hydrolase
MNRVSRRRGLVALAAMLAASPPGGAAAAPAPAAPDDDPVRRSRPLAFPRDHGAHLGSAIEWWYATGWLRAAGRNALLGFQVTFFRSRTGLAEKLPGRLAPRQLLFAHAAITDLAAASHRHAGRLARWSGQVAQDLRAWVSVTDAEVHLDGWSLTRRDTPAGSRYDTQIDAEDFALQLALSTTQPLLLQGDGGFSRKGPDEAQASMYTSEPQLAVAGRVRIDGKPLAVTGRGWIDHEWSDTLLHPQAVGWDWIGFNLDDGSALTAFRLRRADGSSLWTGGCLRAPGAAPRHFGGTDLHFEPGRVWRSPASQARYPVEWTVRTPQGAWTVRALMDAQELDGRMSTGTVYWEGLSELLDRDGRRVGLGYLEMTGYAGRLVL